MFGYCRGSEQLAYVCGGPRLALVASTMGRCLLLDQ